MQAGEKSSRFYQDQLLFELTHGNGSEYFAFDLDVDLSGVLVELEPPAENAIACCFGEFFQYGEGLLSADPFLFILKDDQADTIFVSLHSEGEIIAEGEGGHGIKIKNSCKNKRGTWFESSD
jgi:hypothetical protein